MLAFIDHDMHGRDGTNSKAGCAYFSCVCFHCMSDVEWNMCSQNVDEKT
jgi:hypothetical protein